MARNRTPWTQIAQRRVQSGHPIRAITGTVPPLSFIESRLLFVGAAVAGRGSSGACRIRRDAGFGGA